MLRSSGHETVPLHDGSGGKKMVGDSRIKQQPSPFAVVDPRDEERATTCVPVHVVSITNNSPSGE